MLGQLEHTQIKTFLSIAKGKVVMSTETGKECYSFIEGSLTAVRDVITRFGNEDVRRWYIDIEDKGVLYSLCLPFNSGVYKSIILSLASCENLTYGTRIKIKPYEGRNGFTRVSVYADGSRLNWITHELPPVRTVTIGGRPVRDDGERMKLILELTAGVQNKLRAASAKNDFSNF